MDRLILLFVALLPVVLICIYVYKKDRAKEPIKLLIRLFLSGILSAFMVIIITGILSPFIPFFTLGDGAGFIEVLLHTFLGVAVIEEGCKLIMCYINGYKSAEFDEIYDIILYSIMVSLGFAAFENIIYVLKASSLFLGVVRGVLSIPGHSFFALYMGYHLSLAKIASLKGNKQEEKKNFLLALLIPTTLHGIFDFCLMSQNLIFLIVFFIFVIALYILSIKKLIFVAKNNKSLIVNTNNNQNGYMNINTNANRFCPNCGTPVNTNFCTNCGTKQN